MDNTWVVVAESSRARIFRLNGLLSPLQEINDMLNPEGRAREQDLVSDRQGRSFESIGNGRHAKQQEQSTRQQRSAAFARTLADCIEQGRTQGQFEQIYLIAPPAFLGLLRKNLSDSTRQLIKREIKKNIVRESEDAIRNYLKL